MFVTSVKPPIFLKISDFPRWVDAVIMAIKEGFTTDEVALRDYAMYSHLVTVNEFAQILSFTTQEDRVAFVLKWK